MGIGPVQVGVWLTVAEKALSLWKKYSAWRERRAAVKKAKSVEKAVKGGMVVLCGLLLSGCEEYLNLSNEKTGGESDADLAALVEGAVVVTAGDNSVVEKVDTVDDPVMVKVGNNSYVGPINTHPDYTGEGE